jgi:recombination protein RecR
LNQLIDRIGKENIEEIVFALSPTIDGQTTMHYILSQIKQFHVRCSSLACGVPLGGELDYIDDGTLTLAFKARQNLNDFAA